MSANGHFSRPQDNEWCIVGAYGGQKKNEELTKCLYVLENACICAQQGLESVECGFSTTVYSVRNRKTANHVMLYCSDILVSC